MNDCALDGSIPSEIGGLQKLRKDYCNNCRLVRHPLALILSFIFTEGLGLHNNMLTGSIPSSIGYLTDLSVVYLDNNRLSGSIPNSIGQASNLGE